MRTTLTPLMMFLAACDLGGQEDIIVNVYLYDTGVEDIEEEDPEEEEETGDTEEPEEEEQAPEQVAVTGNFSLEFIHAEGTSFLKSVCTGTYEGVVIPEEPLSLDATCDSDVAVTQFNFTITDEPRTVPISIEGAPRGAGWRAFLGGGYGGESTGLQSLPCLDEALDLVVEGNALVGEVSTDAGESEYDIAFFILDAQIEDTAIGSCVVRFW